MRGMTSFPGARASVTVALSNTFSRATSRTKKSCRSVVSSHNNNQLWQGTEHPQHQAGGATGFRVLQAKPSTFELRCERCHGLRSAFYHNKHSIDPETFPRVGICSRRRTNCAAAKTRCQASYGGLPVIHELPADEATDRLAL
jgi:hypothetical protein